MGRGHSRQSDTLRLLPFRGQGHVECCLQRTEVAHSDSVPIRILIRH